MLATFDEEEEESSLLSSSDPELPQGTCAYEAGSVFSLMARMEIARPHHLPELLGDFESVGTFSLTSNVCGRQQTRVSFRPSAQSTTREEGIDKNDVLQA